MAHAPSAHAQWTAEDVERLSAQGWRVELWKGQLIRMAPTGDLHGRMTWRLSRVLDRYIEEHSLGQMWPAETGFDLTRPDETEQTVLAPDAAFVRAERVPPPVGGFAHVVPDLVVETASPSQSRREMDDKALQWLERGVQLVWVVWPERSRIDEWRPGAAGPRALGTGDVLDGHDVVPGFQVPISRLF